MHTWLYRACVRMYRITLCGKHYLYYFTPQVFSPMSIYIIRIFESTVNPALPSIDFDKTSIPWWYDIIITARGIQNNAVFAIFGNNQTSPVTIIAIKELVFTRPNNVTAIEIVRTDDCIVGCLIIYRHWECARENIVLFAQYRTDAVSAVFRLTLIYFFYFYLHPSSFHMMLDKQYFITPVMIIMEARTLSERHLVSLVYVYICVCMYIGIFHNILHPCTFAPLEFFV